MQILPRLKNTAPNSPKRVISSEKFIYFWRGDLPHSPDPSAVDPLAPKQTFWICLFVLSSIPARLGLHRRLKYQIVPFVHIKSGSATSFRSRGDVERSLQDTGLCAVVAKSRIMLIPAHFRTILSST